RAKTHQTQKSASNRMLARSNRWHSRLMRIKNPESAARDHKHDVATAVAKIRVSREHRVFEQVGNVAVWIDRARSKIIGVNRIIGRKRRRDHFIYPNAGPGEGAIDAAHKPVAVSRVGAFEEAGLFHRSPEFARPNDFEHITHAATEFSFRICTTGNHCDRDKGKSKIR